MVALPDKPAADLLISFDLIRLLLTTTLLLSSLPACAAPETKSITIDKPVKVTVEFPKDFAVKEAQFGGLEIHARKTDDNDAPAMMLLSVSIDLGPDATEESVNRFLQGGKKEAKMISQGKVRYVLNADHSSKVPKNSFINSSYCAALDGVIFLLSTAVVKGRESEPQAREQKGLVEWPEKFSARSRREEGTVRAP